MSKILAFAAITLIALGLFTTMPNIQEGHWSVENNDVNEFKAWKAHHGKAYSNMEEEMYRFKVFLMNKNFVETENAKNAGVTYAINHFSDLTKEEFAATYLTFTPSVSSEFLETATFVGDAPAEVNWTTLGDVSPIQNQGQCGSCWSFSAAQAVESAYAVFKGQNNPTPVLSEQQLVSCAGIFQGYLNFGCNGGQMTEAFRYIQSNPLTTLANYPYTSGESKQAGTCNKSAASLGTYGITGYKAVGNSASDLQNAIAQQPISVAVDATNWSQYKSGIFSDCGTQLNHGVLAVGYVATQYWTVKNSWGTSWGENGFIQVDWNTNCGITMSASFPTV